MVERCLWFLDGALREGDPLVVNVAAVSFVENVGPRDATMSDFIASWPELLRTEAARQRNWKPKGA